jgi:hypothetical protein
MTPVRRRLLNLLTFLSLLLCVAVAALWVRSHWVGDELVRESDGWRRVLRSGCGGVHVSCWYAGHMRQRTLHERVDPPAYPIVAQPAETMLERFGFEVYFGGRLPAGWYMSSPPRWSITLPYWAVSLATAAMPLTALVSVALRRGRSMRGLCPSCGYDLRATPDRCPECGTPASISA